MEVQLLRPPLNELVFELYQRSLHPELFTILASQVLERGDQRLTLEITRTGHVIRFNAPGICLTEVAGAADVVLPDRGRVLRYRLRREQLGKADCGVVQYQMSFQVETVPAEIFLHIHDEILADGRSRGFLHQFQPHNRLAIAPLGFITVEGRSDCIVVHAFHTFPDQHTVVKSQSLIEWRR